MVLLVNKTSAYVVHKNLIRFEFSLIEKVCKNFQKEKNKNEFGFDSVSSIHFGVRYFVRRFSCCSFVNRTKNGMSPPCDLSQGIVRKIFNRNWTQTQR